MLPGVKSPLGVLYITTVAPTSPEPRLGGMCLSNTGQLHVTSSVGTRFNGGHMTTDDGSLCIAAGGAIAGYTNGLPVTSTGQLVTQLNATPVAADPYVGGVRVGAAGVYITDVSIPLHYGFNNGFSIGFNAPP